MNFNRHIIWLLLLLLAGMALAGRLKVEKIAFQGNRSFSDSQLKKVLKTEEKKPFNPKLLRIDRVILTNFYMQNGFLDVWVETGFKRKGDKIEVLFKISEGRRYRLGGLRFTGMRLLTSRQLRSMFNLKNGQIYRQSAIDEGMNRIEEYYFNHGKPYVMVDASQQKEDSLIYVTIRIQENETVHIVNVDYRGLQHVKSFVIRRELEIHPGDLYSRAKIEKSQRNIYGTGLFNFVGMELQPLDSSRTRVRLMINVVEKKPRWIAARFGVAYQQETVYGGTFDLTLEFGHRNLFGTARAVSLTAIPSLAYDFRNNQIYNPKNQFSFMFVEPWIGYTRTPGIFRASYYQVRPLNSADFNYFTSSFQVRHNFQNRWQVTGGFVFSKVRVLTSADTLGAEYFQQTQGRDLIYAINANFDQDKRDNYLNPHEGFLWTNRLKFAYSDSRDNQTGEKIHNRFIKVTLQWNRYQKFPLRNGWVLASRLKWGNIFELGKHVRVPVLERYYLGGASSVRGYPEQLLGPTYVDESGVIKASGGKMMLLANVELRFPVFWLFWGELFTDAGNVWLETNDFRFSDIRSSSGGGIAILTPVGPLRFDYGLKHRPRPGESPGEFHISISFAF